jgi:hypothetical protein
MDSSVAGLQITLRILSCRALIPESRLPRSSERRPRDCGAHIVEPTKRLAGQAPQIDNAVTLAQ